MQIDLYLIKTEEIINNFMCTVTREFETEIERLREMQLQLESLRKVLVSRAEPT